MLEKGVKEEIKGKFRRHEGDTGSPEVQIALITKRIEALGKHFKTNHKDSNSRRGLLMLIGKRRSLLNYLRRNDEKKYQEILAKLKLRR